MKNGLLGDVSFGVITYRITGVHVAIQVRKVAACYVDPQTMTGLHSPGRVGEIDLIAERESVGRVRLASVVALLQRLS